MSNAKCFGIFNFCIALCDTHNKHTIFSFKHFGNQGFAFCEVPILQTSGFRFFQTFFHYSFQN